MAKTFLSPLSVALAIAGLTISGNIAAAEIYKCPNAAGKIEFTDRPCATASGTKVTVQPNSVAAQDQSATRAKREAVDKNIAKMQAADVAENNRRAAFQQARLNECQGYIDEADRQRGWLSSISPAVAASAANEMAIQRRKYHASRCDDVMR